MRRLMRLWMLAGWLVMMMMPRTSHTTQTYTIMRGEIIRRRWWRPRRLRLRRLHAMCARTRHALNAYATLRVTSRNMWTDGRTEQCGCDVRLTGGECFVGVHTHAKPGLLLRRRCVDLTNHFNVATSFTARVEAVHSTLWICANIPFCPISPGPDFSIFIRHKFVFFQVKTDLRLTIFYHDIRVILVRMR